MRRSQASRYRSLSISRSTGTLSYLHVSCLAHRALLTCPDSSVICCSYLHIVAFGDCRVTLPCCPCSASMTSAAAAMASIQSAQPTMEHSNRVITTSISGGALHRRVSVSLLLFLILILLFQSALSPVSIVFFGVFRFACRH